MNSDMKVLTSILTVNWIVTLIGYIVFGVWLHWLYKKHRDPAFAWLRNGISIIPLINFVCTFFLNHFVFGWFVENGRDYLDYFNVFGSIVLSLFGIASSICIFIALSKFANGAVPFSALFSPLSRHDESDAN